MAPDRGAAGRLNRLCPDRYCPLGVTEIDPGDLVRLGIRAVLLDVDNTLVGWQREDVPEAVVQWVASLKAAGLRLYLVSNTRFPRRLARLAARLDVRYVRKAAKPRRAGFLEALADLQVEPSEAVMVGDQILTDILGGNRVGMRTILVAPMAGREFVGTKLTRMAEAVVLVWLRRTGRL